MLGLWTFVLLFVDLKSTCSAPASDVQSAESIRLTFQNVTLDQWHKQNKSALLKIVVANFTTSYCNANPTNCGLGASNTNEKFDDANIHIIDNYPVMKDDNLEVLLYVQTTATNNEPSTVIPHNTLTTILTEKKDDVQSFMGVHMSSVASGQEESEENKKGNKELNKIMIPIAFLLVILIALLAWTLHRAKKNKLEKEERVLLRRYAKRREQDGQNNEQVNNPSYDINTQVNINNNKPESPDALSPDHSLQYSPKCNRRHKNAAVVAWNKPIRNRHVEESDDVTVSEDPDSGSDDVDNKPKKKGRRRQGNRARNWDQDGINNENNIDKKRLDESGSGGTEQDNKGYIEDSEGQTGSGRSKTSDADSAVELNSSLPPSASHQQRGIALLPIKQNTGQD